MSRPLNGLRQLTRPAALRLLHHKVFMRRCVEEHKMSRREIADLLGVHRKTVKEAQDALGIPHVVRP